jgi:hypothetical protein
MERCPLHRRSGCRRLLAFRLRRAYPVA